MTMYIAKKLDAVDVVFNRDRTNQLLFQSFFQADFHQIRRFDLWRFFNFYDLEKIWKLEEKYPHCEDMFIHMHGFYMHALSEKAGMIFDFPNKKIYVEIKDLSHFKWRETPYYLNAEEYSAANAAHLKNNKIYVEVDVSKIMINGINFVNNHNNHFTYTAYNYQVSESFSFFDRSKYNDHQKMLDILSHRAYKKLQTQKRVWNGLYHILLRTMNSIGVKFPGGKDNNRRKYCFFIENGKTIKALEMEPSYPSVSDIAEGRKFSIGVTMIGNAAEYFKKERSAWRSADYFTASKNFLRKKEKEILQTYCAAPYSFVRYQAKYNEIISYLVFFRRFEKIIETVGKSTKTRAQAKRMCARYMLRDTSSDNTFIGDTSIKTNYGIYCLFGRKRGHGDYGNGDSFVPCVGDNKVELSFLENGEEFMRAPMTF